MGRQGNDISQADLGMWTEHGAADARLQRFDLARWELAPAAFIPPPFPSDVIAFINNAAVTGSLRLGNLPLLPAPCFISLAGSLQKRRDCVQMCLERGQPLCPGRTCGLGVFTLALFQAVSHTACWRLALLDDNAQPSSHKRVFLRLG